MADLNDDMNLAPSGKKAEKKPFPWLVVGGGLVAAGAVWWFFLRKTPEEAATEQKEEVIKTSGEEFSTVGLDGGSAAAAATGGATAAFAKGKGAKGRSITTAQALRQQGLRGQKGMVRPMLAAPQKFRPSMASGSTRTAASLPVQRTPIAPPAMGRRR